MGKRKKNKEERRDETGKKSRGRTGRRRTRSSRQALECKEDMPCYNRQIQRAKDAITQGNIILKRSDAKDLN